MGGAVAALISSAIPVVRCRVVATGGVVCLNVEDGIVGGIVVRGLAVVGLVVGLDVSLVVCLVVGGKVAGGCVEACLVVAGSLLVATDWVGFFVLVACGKVVLRVVLIIFCAVSAGFVCGFGVEWLGCCADFCCCCCVCSVSGSP